MKLTNEELQELNSIVKNFHSVDYNLSLLEKRIKEIEDEKEEISKKIKKLEEKAHSVRATEKEFTDKLVNKYGPFKLNLETFEIEPS